MEFHISRHLRDKLKLDDTLFSFTGSIVFANVQAARRLARQLSGLESSAWPRPVPQPDPLLHTSQRTQSPAETAHDAVNAGALFAMGLIDELNHALIATFRKQLDPAVWQEALRWFGEQTSAAAVETLLNRFTSDFPGIAVYRREQSEAEWLAGTTEDLPNREAAFEELLLLWLANRNPALASFRALFAEGTLVQQTAYTQVMDKLPAYFATRPVLAPEVGTLLDALMAPMLASPDSLTGQLAYIRAHWEAQLGPVLQRVLLAVDVLREEDLAIWARFHPPVAGQYRSPDAGGGAEGFEGDQYVGFEDQFEEVTGPDGQRRRVRKYATDYQAPLNEYEAFSADQAWMPNVVMMAKSTYVWLEQLSQKYGRHIQRLDQIPEEELQILADRGITALWLIGLWERSTASQTIKRLRGHADAVASAYSLKEYKIAEDLGGNSGYEALRDHAGRFGIRLASDMVPNHMGLDSNWVIEHPEWFIARWESPFPVYTFEGPDLSTDSRVEIKIEDHYYDQTDAAVAFRLKHHGRGETRYMYHGNDGTTFAWNDTAQLDYAKAEVREHVIQTILHVARLFPIIRFDAAMVLAKRHVQRLWFPLPGAGGAIPSRAEDAMSQDQFDALMPAEFWRKVVDRVALEVPGTLLLAEAFWLLEGYFVRTLGMHRVYNSAFMNMLRDEENAKYRSYLKKTVEFDPDILKRYVNFMSNPDERTALDQFGSGDKFFGCCTLLATLPGLPMFGHGQIEGFTERYGMEFKQAKMREVPDESLIARHQREIAPLLKRRAIFAESEHFLLYDFWCDGGTVDENVFAYSNRAQTQAGAQRSIVLYNNAYSSTAGTIHLSVGSMDKGSGAMRQRRLDEGLDLRGEGAMVLAYRDATSGLEYLRRVWQVREQGLKMPLRGYQYAVLLDWRELQSTAQEPWDALCDALNGAGVHSVEQALSKLRTRPLLNALREAVSYQNVMAFVQLATDNAAADPGVKVSEQGWDGVRASNGHRRSGSGISSGSHSAKQLEPFFESSGQFFELLYDMIDERERRVLPQRVNPELVPTPTALSSTDSLSGAVAGKKKEVVSAPVAASPTPATSAAVYRHTLEQLSAAVIQLPRFAPGMSVNGLFPAAGSPTDPVRLWTPIIAYLALISADGSVALASAFESLQMRVALAEVFSALGFEGDSAWRAAARVRLLLQWGEHGCASFVRKEFWREPDVRWLLGVNEAHGVTYFDKAAFTRLATWLSLPAMLTLPRDAVATERALLRVTEEVEQVVGRAAEAGYQVEGMLDLEQSPKLSAGEAEAPAMEQAEDVDDASADVLKSASPLTGRR